MTFTVTLTLAICFALLAALCGWLGARPRDLRKAPRLMPWRFMMLLFAVGCLWMLIHLANLAGVNTGRN